MDALPKSYTILMADDDDEDCLLVRDALALNVIPHDLRTVPDGVELLDYLDRRGKYEDRRHSPRPDLILLDLNMPRKDGREALGELKADRRWRHIPIVVLTTSTSDDDVSFSYRSGTSVHRQALHLPGLGGVGPHAQQVLVRSWPGCRGKTWNTGTSRRRRVGFSPPSRRSAMNTRVSSNNGKVVVAG